MVERDMDLGGRTGLCLSPGLITFFCVKQNSTRELRNLQKAELPHVYLMVPQKGNTRQVSPQTQKTVEISTEDVPQ